MYLDQAAVARDAVELRRRRRPRGQDGQVRAGPTLLQRLRGRPGRGRGVEGGAPQLQRPLEGRGNTGVQKEDGSKDIIIHFVFPLHFSMQVGYYLVKSPSRKAKYPRQVILLPHPGGNSATELGLDCVVA